MIYLIGSLRNPNIPTIANQLRDMTGQEVFDDWYAAGPEADDHWKAYEEKRGHSYSAALRGHAANHVFQFDRLHLSRADTVVLCLPAGRSGHLELGWALGSGKRGYILLDDPDRWDVMYQFATGIFTSLDSLTLELMSATAFLNRVFNNWMKGRGGKLPTYMGVSQEVFDKYLTEVQTLERHSDYPLYGDSRPVYKSARLEVNPRLKGLDYAIGGTE